MKKWKHNPRQGKVKLHRNKDRFETKTLHKFPRRIVLRQLALECIGVGNHGGPMRNGCFDELLLGLAVQEKTQFSRNLTGTHNNEITSVSFVIPLHTSDYFSVSAKLVDNVARILKLTVLFVKTLLLQNLLVVATRLLALAVFQDTSHDTENGGRRDQEWRKEKTKDDHGCRDIGRWHFKSKRGNDAIRLCEKLEKYF